MRDAALTKALKIIGGPKRAGELLGISSQAVTQWTRCPADRVIAIEEAVGGKVSRHELRPDIFGALPKKVA